MKKENTLLNVLNKDGSMITYIVATYLGKRRSKLYNRCWDIDIYFLVRKHLEQLSKLDVPEISQIVFAVNHYNYTVDQGIKNIVGEYKLKIPVEVIYRANEGLSYGAWNDSMVELLERPTDYYFLIEDDYLPVADKFYQHFIDQVTEATGFVGQLINYNHPTVHPSISNGLMPYTTAKALYVEKKSILNLIPAANKSDGGYLEGTQNQITCLQHIIDKGLEIKDVSQTTYIPFLESQDNSEILDRTIYFGNPDMPIPIKPAQTLDTMLSFRLMSESDVRFVNSVRNRYSKTYLHDSRTFTDEEALTWYKKSKPEFYIIEYLNKDIGYFRTSSYSKENRHICIGCDISPEFTNRGLGYISYRAFIGFIFKKYDLNKVYLEVLSTNERAIYLYEKLGFIKEGVKREEVLKDGEYIDSVIYSILKKEYNFSI